MYPTNFSGPLLSDKKFFSELIDLNLSGLEEIKELLIKEDYKACRKVFAKFFKSYLEPNKYFKSSSGSLEGNTLDENGSYCLPTNEAIIEDAEKACRHYMVSCGTPSDFGENKVDWYSNPTYNGYKEWPWQLSRHAELSTLATAYSMTKNEKYAYACAELFDSWVKQAEAPAPLTGHGETLSWRTIECGIRQGGCWPYVIHTFYKTEAFNEDIITDWCKSVYEHAERLFTVHGGNNWLLMEMNGLAHIAVIYGFFKESSVWLKFACDTMSRELIKQVHPDGFQYELTTDYQHVAITTYGALLTLLTNYDIEPDKNFSSYVEKMIETYVHLAEPNMIVPDINDGMKYNAKGVVADYAHLFPENQLFKWVLSDKKEGTPPIKDHIFENAGLAVLRTGLTENDTWLFFDGGEFGAGHQHEDKLNLLMYADGKLILTEAGKYAYDASIESKYTLSTRAHNTVRVDNFSQCRRKNYKWKGEIDKISDLKYKLDSDIDVLYSFYNEGYGNKKGETSARHERKVLFIKNQKSLKPFAIAIDRLYGEEKDHLYGIMWHLDSNDLSMDKLNIKADTLNIFVSDEEFTSNELSLSVCRGQMYPEMQGFFCNSHNQKDYRPIYCAEYKVYGNELRIVTVLYPDGNEPCPIEKVIASKNTSDNDICLILKNGEKINLNEKEIAPEI